MNTYELILRRRTIRSFSQRNIKKKNLFECINAARLAPSAANLQPLEYILVVKNLDKVFYCTHWAGYLKNWNPEEGERPTAFIVIISNITLNADSKYDVGLAVGNIILTALEKGIATCIMGSLDREALIKNLNISKHYKVELVVALGYPKQKSVDVQYKGDVKYWLDKKGVLHVPKRKYSDIFHEEKM